MNLEKYLVVAGLPGVHKLVSTRGNGLIIDDRTEKRTRFVTVRQNPVTPLGTIGIYIDDDGGGDTISLGEVFEKMEAVLAANPLPDPKADSTVFRNYFSAVLPNHDRDRVHINDIKKCVKWFGFMHQNGMLEEARKAAETTEAAAETEEKAAETPAAPKAKAAKAAKTAVEAPAETVAEPADTVAEPAETVAELAETVAELAEAPAKKSKKK
jgi:chemotaxis protein histidine kinase CheA